LKTPQQPKNVVDAAYLSAFLAVLMFKLFCGRICIVTAFDVKQYANFSL
jgi:hypothetical protein